MMNVDHILDTFNRHRVSYLLIGGMNFLLRHAPVLTYDVDLWIRDSPDNLERCETALAELEAQWGESETQWRPVAERTPGWLQSQAMFCLTSPHGAIDVFRSVKGLESWTGCLARARKGRTSGQVEFVGLADEDMLQCQMALPEQLIEREHRKREACWDPAERWRVLQETIAWADAQAEVSRNSPAKCLELQAARQVLAK